MTRFGTCILGAACLAGAAVGATAIAAEPDSGTVSADVPKVAWKGHITDGSYLTSRAMILEDASARHGSVPCEQGCDTFTLTVATPADLTVATDSPSEDSADPDQVVLRIKKPDGSYLTTIGESSKGRPLTVKFKKAATGAYVIDYSNNYAAAQDYDGSAQLAVAPPAPPPGQNPPSDQPPPNPAPAPGDQQQGNPQPGPTQDQNIDLTIKPRKASLRKLRRSRKLVASVKVSREVASLEGFLRKGKATIGKAKRGKTAGTVKVTLKLAKKAARKLRKGTLTLTFVARDAQGTSASKTVKVKVRR